MSLRELEAKSGWNFAYLGQIERGTRLGSRQIAQDCDDALGAGGALVAKYEQDQPTRGRAVHTSAHTDLWPSIAWIPTLESDIEDTRRDIIDRRGFLGGMIASAIAAPLLPFTPATASTPPPQMLAVAGPAGTWYPGAVTPAIAFTARTAGRGVLLDAGAITGLRAPLSGRHLLIGIDEHGCHFAADAAAALAHHRQGLAEAPVRIPTAHQLDELTGALLWALSNLEQSLHADDAVIDQASTAGPGRLDLTPVTQAWLGSSACAAHLLANLDRIDRPAQFWTRERTGEEASTWLFFAHKVAYLQSTRNLYRSTAATATRTFCIPEATLAGTSTQERLLLLMALALMESFTVAIRVCTHLEYAATDGFATDSSTAIIATWVRAANQVTMDVVANRPSLADFDDAIRHTGECNAAPGDTPVQRLQSAAAFLGIDWAWFATRCTQIASTGLDTLLVPRSRHLTIDGPARACDFIARLHQPT
ncbi:helix-turn-helix transcriptional regulator [Glycomyces sp. NPDC047369]